MLAHVSTAAPVSADLGTAVTAIFLGAALVLVVGVVIADRGGRLPRSSVPFARWTAILAACLSLGAAAIHFAVIGGHFAEYPPYGVAFAALAWFQVAWVLAYLVVRDRAGDRPVAIAAIVVNGGALVVWAMSRLFGLPIGPQPGELEPVGPLDLVAGALEIALIAVLAWDLGARTARFRPALAPAGASVVVGSGALAVILLTSAALVASGGDAHAGAAHDAATMTEPTTGDASATASITVDPGEIRFGIGLDLTGQIATPATGFAPGETAIWVADFREAPAVPTIVLMIVQVLSDGREFEHWRQEIVLDDPSSRRLVAGADLQVYVHGGEGSYRMRYVRADELLAEGTFELVL